MTREDSPEAVSTASKLALIRSPLVTDSGSSIDALPIKRTTAPDLALFGNRYDDDCPQFLKVRNLQHTLVQKNSVC